jgi:DNA helicase-2/ATP-dependent DNA helicase PcrA
VVDFAELMLRTYELMRDNDPLREHYQQRFRHVLVDEFQDTNKLQYAWLKMFAPPGSGQGVFAVGDDDQSIYAFRGAQVGNMADFEREYRVRGSSSWSRTTAPTATSSTPPTHLIATTATAWARTCAPTPAPASRCACSRPPATSPRRSGCSTRPSNCTAAARRAQEIALLYRSNAQSRVIESALFNAGVPYRVYGGLRFFERAEVKHALAYLRLLENPNDDTSFLRVVNFPARGIGARTSSSCRTRHAPAAAACARASARWPAAGVAAAGFVRSWSTMRAATQGLTLREIIEHMLHASGLLDLLQDREGRPGPHREPGGTGQRRRELRHAGGLRQGRRGAAGRRDNRRPGRKLGPTGARRRDRRDHVARWRPS